MSNTLKNWIDTHNFSYSKFGRMVGVSHRQQVYRYVNGLSTPCKRIMTKIYLITGGEVTADSFLFPKLAADTKKKAVNFIKICLDKKIVLQKQLAYLLKISDTAVSKKLKKLKFRSFELEVIKKYISKEITRRKILC